MKILLLVLLAGELCLAQVPPEQAQRAMEQRKAAQEAARAQLVQITAGELADLRAELALLKRQLADLQAQLAANQADPFAGGAAANGRQRVDPAILRAIRDHELVPGMTLEQAERSLGANARKLEVADNTQKVQWDITRATETIRQTQTITAVFKDGTLSSTTFDTHSPETIERRSINVGTVTTDARGDRDDQRDSD